MSRSSSRVSLLEVQVDLVDMQHLQRLVALAIDNHEKSIIANHNLHSVYLFNHNEDMRRFYAQAKYIHVDGMSLIGIGRFLGLPMRREHRITYVDWVYPLIREAAQNGWRVYYLGSKPGVAESAAETLRMTFPNLHIATHHGYFNVDCNHPENVAVLEDIRQFAPQILMVGMGMPRQEFWILNNIDDIHANVILTAGACMDYVAGTIPTPPRWMGQVGLEWLYRLASEPGRLWKRYLLEPWFLLTILGRDLLGRLK